MKPLQLLVTANEETPSTTVVEHLNTICSILKNISDTKFSTCSYPDLSSDSVLREESPLPDVFDENLDSHYNNLFLQIYKYSHKRILTKNKRRLQVLESFGNQLTVWKNRVPRERGNRLDLDEPHKVFIDEINALWVSGSGMEICLNNLSQSGWKLDLTERVELRGYCHLMQAEVKYLLGQKAGGISMCEYWAMKVFPANQRPDSKKKPLQLRRAIEKLVSFYCHVFSLIRFANSKRMRSSFFLSKITIISAEKTHPSALSWPSNKREWGDILESIKNKHNLIRESGSDVKKAEQKLKSRATRYGVAAIVHCECAMVAYLHKYPTLQAFSYIGVPKLCCKACHYWMVAFNRTMSTAFRTRGIHDKWNGGWARPGLGKAANQNKVDAMFCL